MIMSDGLFIVIVETTGDGGAFSVVMCGSTYAAMEIPHVAVPIPANSRSSL